jgi:protein SCO1/2
LSGRLSYDPGADGRDIGEAGHGPGPHRTRLHHHPERDTPDVLKKYTAAFGPRFVGLTGTPDQIAKVEKEFRVYAKKGPVENGTYAMDHSSVMYLMGPDGTLVSFYDEATTPEDLAQKLKSKL